MVSAVSNDDQRHETSSRRKLNMTEAIILCGGAGLRLRSVTGNDPKSMARVAGGPFLGMLLKQLRRHAFQRVILAVGYAGAAIQSYFGERFGGMDVEYSNELVAAGDWRGARKRRPANSDQVLAWS